MSKTPVLTVLIKNKSCMNTLGAIIGKHLVDPRIYPLKNPIACAYGVKNGGKSTLLTESGVAILSKAQGSYRSESDVEIIRKDFAFNGTYPYGKRDIFGTWSMLEAINKNKKEPAAHLFEHSPVNVLAKGDVGIVISWPAQPKRTASGVKPHMNNFYLTGMANNLESSARKTGLEDGAVAKVIDQLRKAGKDTCKDPGKRIVRLFPLSNAPRVEKALKKTREKVKNAPHLSVITP